MPPLGSPLRRRGAFRRRWGLSGSPPDPLWCGRSPVGVCPSGLFFGPLAVLVRPCASLVAPSGSGPAALAARARLPPGFFARARAPSCLWASLAARCVPGRFALPLLCAPSLFGRAFAASGWACACRPSPGPPCLAPLGCGALPLASPLSGPGLSPPAAALPLFAPGHYAPCAPPVPAAPQCLGGSGEAWGPMGGLRPPLRGLRFSQTSCGSPLPPAAAHGREFSGWFTIRKL